MKIKTSIVALVLASAVAVCGGAVMNYGVPAGAGGVEVDPEFNESPAAGITAQNLVDFATAYGWGDHSAVGYVRSWDGQAANPWLEQYGIGLFGGCANPMEQTPTRANLACGPGLRVWNGGRTYVFGGLDITSWPSAEYKAQGPSFLVAYNRSGWSHSENSAPDNYELCVTPLNVAVGAGCILHVPQIHVGTAGLPNAGYTLPTIDGAVANLLTANGDGTTSWAPEADPIFLAWLLATPPVYAETDPAFQAWIGENPLNAYVTVEADPVWGNWWAQQDVQTGADGDYDTPDGKIDACNIAERAIGADIASQATNSYSAYGAEIASFATNAASAYGANIASVATNLVPLEVSPAGTYPVYNDGTTVGQLTSITIDDGGRITAVTVIPAP